MDNIINEIKKQFEYGYSKKDTIIKIMYLLFPGVDLIFNDTELEITTSIYDKYVKGAIYENI